MQVKPWFLKFLSPLFGMILSFGSVHAQNSLLENLLSSDPALEDEPLHVDKAFKFSSLPPAKDSIGLRWQIADKHYLYRHTFKFAVDDEDSLQLGKAIIPPGKPKTDQFFGDIEVYYGDLDITLPFSRKSNQAINATLTVTYQGCAERGICYPPEKKKVLLNLPLVKTAAAAIVEQAKTSANNSKIKPETQSLSEHEQIAFAMQNQGLFGNILLFLLAGLALAFTPCVFPMIPILSGIIVGHGEDITPRKAFMISLIYVLAMSVMFAIAGVIAGLTGESFQAIFQKPWVIGAFSLIFVALALSMFGFFELQMPTSIQGKLASISNNQKSGSYIGVAVMGVLSALIVGACVTPVLIAAILYISQTGNSVLGGLSLFALGLGMGLPLIVIGTLGGKLMLQKGSWMNTVKYVFGVLLLGLAIWLAGPILPHWITVLLAAILIIVSGIYMGALESIPIGKSLWFKLWKGLGLVLITYGILLLIGIGTGKPSLIKPLKGLTTGSSGSARLDAHLEFVKIKSFANLEQELARAKAAGQFTMLDFYADWCVACKELETFTFSDPKVQTALSKVKLLQADVTANDDVDRELMKKLGIIGPPAILFYTPDAKENRALRLVGFKNSEEFLAHIGAAGIK